MSQVHQTTALPEGPVSNLTLVVLLLIPCVVILLLLNCLFLGYKLIILSKKTNRREDTEAILLHSALPGARRLSDVAFPLQSGRRAYMSLSEPVLPQPVTSSRASSKERPGFDHRIRLLRPDGATGSGLCDKMDMECELSNTLSEVSCILTSAVGPGLDSDFGASAVSLRILSADSDGLSNGVLTSALEWDYYDPCYVKQNNVPKQKHHRPVLHTKQYWV
uniref:Protein huluwa-like n=1 Tax=Periophthalmus magnuspinnatus TaxID=409849 RepID=A0A3B3ZLY9_9GOBI